MGLVSSADVLTFMQATGDATATGLVNLLLPFSERMCRRFVGYQIEQNTFTEYHPFESINPSMHNGDFIEDEVVRWEGSSNGAIPIRYTRNSGKDAIALKNIPVRSIVSIHDDPLAWERATDGERFPVSTLLQQGRDYIVDWDGTDEEGNNISQTGFVYRTSGIWSTRERVVKVVYVGGFSSGELASAERKIGYDQVQDFRLAVIMTCTKFVTDSKLNRYANTGTGIIASESHDNYSISFASPGVGPDINLTFAMPEGAMKILEGLIRYSNFL